MVNNIKVISIVVEDYADVLSFEVFDIFLNFLVLIFRRTLRLSGVSSVTQ
jgi:hypothetical protein